MKNKLGLVSLLGMAAMFGVPALPSSTPSSSAGTIITSPPRPIKGNSRRKKLARAARCARRPWRRQQARNKLKNRPYFRKLNEKNAARSRAAASAAFNARDEMLPTFAANLRLLK